MTKKVFLKIVLLWAVFIIGIGAIPFLLSSISLISTPVQNFTELAFAVWGYGWDGGHYIAIATKGYHFPTQAFFPLYPLLIAALNTVLPLALSYRVNVILLLGTLISLYYLMKHYHFSEQQKQLGLLAFLFFPGSFYLQANYTETFFILLSSVALNLYLNKKMFLAFLVTGFVGAVKISGLGLIGTLIIGYFKTASGKYKIAIAPLLIALANLGWITYFLYLNTYHKTYTVFFRAQNEWGRTTQNIIDKPLFLLDLFPRLIQNAKNLDPWFTRELIELICFMLIIYFLVISFRKIRWELWLFSLVQIFIPLSSGSILSFPRLMLLAYPIILFFGKKLENPFVLTAYVFCTTLLQALMIVMFMNNKFVA